MRIPCARPPPHSQVGSGTDKEFVAHVDTKHFKEDAQAKVDDHMDDKTLEKCKGTGEDVVSHAPVGPQGEVRAERTD